MERSERAGLGIALVGHAGLFALLSLRFLQPPLPPSLEQPVEVSLVDEVGLTQAAPPSPIPPSVSQAPEQGKPEEEAAPPHAVPVPTPKPVPAKPTPPKAKPAKPAERPDADRLAAIAADAERADAQRVDKAAAAKAAHDAWVEKVKAANAAKAEAAREAAEARTEAARAAAAAKAEAAKVAAAKAEQAHAAAVARAEEARAAVAAKAEQARATAAAKAEQARADAAAKAEAARAAAAAARPRGSRLGADFLKGLADTPTKAAPSAAAPGVMSAQALAGIADAIRRQIQPCANRQVNPGPGAERIRVSVNLKLNRDGSLAAPPRVVNHYGLDVENRRYLDRVDDLAIATFVGCAPMRGLPGNLYDVPNGWRSITMNYNLPG